MPAKKSEYKIDYEAAREEIGNRIEDRGIGVVLFLSSPTLR